MRLRLPRQNGTVLVITLAFGVLLGSILISYLAMISSINDLSSRSQAWNTAIAVAEAGIEEALTHISFTNYLASNGWSPTADGRYVKSRVFGDNSYTVGITNPVAPVLYATGYVSMGTTTNRISRQVKVTTRKNSLFSKGLVAKGSVVLGGGVRTDSFNSTDTNYSTGGFYDPAKFKDNGDVATDAEVISAITGMGGVTIFGHVSTGPNGTISFNGQATAGSRTFILGGGTGIQAGWSSDDMNVNFPDVQPPFNGGAYTPASGTVNGTNFAYVLGSGNYQMNELNLGTGSNLAVTNNAVLYVTGNIGMTG